MYIEDGTGSPYEAEQMALAVGVVESFFWHPAVLMWGVGNEVEVRTCVCVSLYTYLGA